MDPVIKLPVIPVAGQPDLPVAPHGRTTPTWAKPFLDYLTQDILPEGELQARQVLRCAKGYTIINDELYKRNIADFYQRYVEQAEGRRLLERIHKGECGHHASSRSIAAKAMWYGFFWPSALADAEELVRTCNGC